MSDNGLRFALELILASRHSPQMICAPNDTTTYWIEQQRSTLRPWAIWKAEYVTETRPRISQISSHQRLAASFSSLGVIQEQERNISPDPLLSAPTQHSMCEIGLIRDGLSYLLSTIESSESRQLTRELLQQYHTEYNRLQRRSRN